MSFITDAVGGLLGTKQQADAATLAGQQQADSQRLGQAQLQANLQPYAQFGASAMPNIMKLLGLGGTGGGFQFNPQDYANTPAYQFILGQGMKNTNNALSNQGLLGSGAQAKALADYTTGLANTTYNDQFKNALAGFQGNLTPLLSLLTMGQNAATGIGQGGYNSAVNAGNAIAQGTIGSGAQSANTFNGLMGMANLANTAGATYSPTAGYQSGLSNIFSDIRAKENIEFRGYTPKGHKVYEFEYKPEFKERAGHGKFVGVMAQEVEKILPEAITVTPDGYKTVNYGLIG